MKLAIMQPYFFPYIGYFQLINAADKFVIYDDVNYINKGWVNRNNILLNGKSSLIHVPLQNASQNKLINEILIVQEGKWKLKMLKTLEQNYKRAPFFVEVFTLIQSILNADITIISQLNFLVISKVCNYLKINSLLIPSSTIYNNKHLKGQERIIDICKQENAKHYINPSGGVELYDKSKFEQEAIQLNFLKPNNIEYKQFNHSYVPQLSIIDIMMFYSPESIKNEFLNKFELV